MDILFTSCGRRDYLVDYFQEALDGQGCVHVANSDPVCASFLSSGPKVVTPPIYSVEYIPFLLTYCREHGIGAIIPLFDVDLPVLAEARAEFAKIGTCIVVADLPVARLCNDKWLTFLELRRHGFAVPETFLGVDDALRASQHGSLRFPLVVKPRWGMGSVGLMQAHNSAELPYVVEWVRRAALASHASYESKQDTEHCVLMQEHLSGDEFGLDVLNDLEGNYVCTAVRRKIAMRAGETDIARTERIPQLEELGMRLGKLLRHRGALDVDLFYDGTTATVIEMNARFGGGYPFSHLSGVNFPAAIVAWLQSREPWPENFSGAPNVVGLKQICPVDMTRPAAHFQGYEETNQKIREGRRGR